MLSSIFQLNINRGRRNTYHHTTLLKLDAVNDTDSSNFYLGKKVAFIYKSKVAKAGSKFRGAVKKYFISRMNIDYYASSFNIEERSKIG